MGRAESTNYSVHVKDGLAVVRSATSERLALWQSAPSFELTIDLETAKPVELELNNTMSGAVLVVRNGDATLESHAANDAKTRRWLITPQHNGTLTLVVEPEHTQVAPFRFALMSDVQEAIEDVSDVYDAINQIGDLEFLLGAGDLTQRGERSQLQRFERELTRLKVPYYTTLGNHELGVEPPLFHDFYGRGSVQLRTSWRAVYVDRQR